MQTITFRVLNDYDLSCDIENNGIASKKMIYDIVKNSLISNKKSGFYLLNKEEQDEIIKSQMVAYLEKNQRKLNDKFLRKLNPISTSINEYVKQKNNLEYANILHGLSTLNSHLLYGSKNYTDWISATTSFDAMFKYYDKQQVHKVACIKTITNGVFNEDTLIVDVSNKEVINKLKCLGNKVDDEDFKLFLEITKQDSENIHLLYNTFLFKKTNPNFRGFSYSTFDKEVCFYKYIKPEYIACVLEQLHIDLICADLFNTDYVLLPVNEQKKQLNELKELIRFNIINNPLLKKEFTNTEYLLYVYEQLYENNMNMDFIVQNEYEKEKLKNTRKRLLSYISRYNSPMLKK